MKKLVWLVVAGAASLGVLTALMVAVSADSDTRPRAARQVEPPADDSAVAGTPQRVVRRGADWRPSSRAPMRAEGESATPTDSPRASPIRQPDAVHDALEQVAQGDTADPSWSSETRERLTTVLGAEELAGNRILSAACGTRLCRVEVGHDTANAGATFMEHLGDVAGDGVQGFARRLDGRTVVYFSRPGQQLPGVK